MVFSGGSKRKKCTNQNIVSRFSRVSFCCEKRTVKMEDLVLQFSTKKSLLGLIRKKKLNSTIASKVLLNFDFIVKISNFEVNKRNVEKAFLYRLTLFSTRCPENCGTRSIFRDTYFFSKKID